jgi:RNA polymerase sigma factor (TIGR02999 family)
MSEVTTLLNRWTAGDKTAFDELMPIIYRELKQMASGFLARESANATLNPTALVHEAYLRLVRQEEVRWDGRAHFFGAASQTMRRILVDAARARLAAKRGSGVRPESLDGAITVALAPDLDILALDEALTELAAIDPDRARVVELRFFGDLTLEEVAIVMDTSVSTVRRDWAFARAWLYRRLGVHPKES